MRRILLAVALAVVMLTAGPRPLQAQVSPDIIDGVIARTVLLIIVVPAPEGRLRAVGICTGSFITPTGYILTASHCVRARSDKPEVNVKKGDLMNPDGLVPVALNVPGYVSPVPMMMAKFVADSVPLDLAIIKVDRLIGQGGARPLPADFVVPYIKIGNSDALRHGEPIAVVGFPGVGGNSVSVNQGNVSGFLADEQNQKTWLKIDASGAGPGNSGGPVVNARGEQVGAISHGEVDPTQAARSVRAALVNRIPAEWRQTARLEPAPGSGGGPSPGSGVPAPGSGGGAQPGQASATVVVQGRVTDAANSAPVAGANIFLFKPGVNPRSATREDVLASGVTDGNGLFQTRPPVQRGASYPIAIVANGYAPIVGTLNLATGGGEVVQVTVQLQR
ncbi:MAG: trypsin-like peptidase domain-containing protein [Armatimonadota bacterium]